LGYEKHSISEELLEPLILRIRGRRVIRDFDLARLYGVTTKALNQAVKRNVSRFPVDFAFQLSRAEAADLRVSMAASTQNSSKDHGDARDRSQIVTGSQQHRRSAAFRPWAFAEHGALMAANVLRSNRAVQMSIFVIRAFVRLREHVAANTAILKRLAEIDETLLQHDVGF
jgi:hypothetical protein